MLQWFAPSGDSSEPTYLYDNPGAHTINLRGVFITQHGRKIRTISAKVQDLDRMCRTPEIKDRDNSEMDNLYMMRNIPWQRALNQRRMMEDGGGERVPPAQMGYWYTLTKGLSSTMAILIANLLSIPRVGHLTSAPIVVGCPGHLVLVMWGGLRMYALAVSITQNQRWWLTASTG